MSSSHNIHAILSSTQNDRPTAGKSEYIPGVGYLRAWGVLATDVSTGDTGYAKGCMLQDTTSGAIYRNTGDKDSAVWAAFN